MRRGHLLYRASSQHGRGVAGRWRQGKAERAAACSCHDPSATGGHGGDDDGNPDSCQGVLALKKDLNEILLRHTGQSLERIEEDTDRDKFMSAKEALDYGIVDNVLERLPVQLQPKPASG